MHVKSGCMHVDTGATYAFNRNLGYVGTFFHFAAHTRSSSAIPDLGRGVIWFGVDDASLSVRVPMYAATAAAPPTWAFGNGDTAHYVQRYRTQ
eukprot:m.487521 g.487521  ORF g.487521 m.487521 type:complete len:93 (-) comp21754_c0_seq12:1076-1354(-)